ncbi:MAG TPA: tRNA modification GTPase, partial [Ramlibacter sp.]
ARCLEAGAAMALRVAEPGEFTQRAFLNGKLDLAQAEAIADLIDASTEAAARSATRSLAGEFSREIHALRDALVHLRMLVEATLDFPEEEIDFLQKADAQGQLERLQQNLARVMQRAHQGALLREGLHVVIAGQPNAGKSSLLNALAGAELAIVTPIAGTTRDIVRQTIQIEGVPLHVVDTAGLREGAEEVEQIGIERAWGQIEKADAVLFLHDLTRADAADYRAADEAIAARLPRDVPVIDVWNKADALPVTRAEPLPVIPAEAAPVIPAEAAPVITAEAGTQGFRCGAATPWIPASAGMTGGGAAGLAGRPAGVAREGAGMTGGAAGMALSLSAKTGEGLEALRRTLLDIAGWQAAPEGVFIARERHLQALRRVDAHLMEAAALLARQAQALDLLAEELRLAQNGLSEITGEFSADDLLGVIFSRFCIGK